MNESDNKTATSHSKQLPRGWIELNLGDIVRFSSGVSRPQNMVPESNLDNNVHVYGGNGILGYTSEVLSSEKHIVIGRVGHYCGNVHIANPPSWITDNALFSTTWLLDWVELEYLAYYLTHSNLNRFKKSTGQPVISQSSIQHVRIPLPPPREQRRIAAKIEELFTHLQAAAEYLKEVKKELKRHRNSVLKLAFEGELTAKWRKEHKSGTEPISKTLERLATRRRTKKKGEDSEIAIPDLADLRIPKEWIWARLDRLCEKIQDGTHFSPKIQYTTPAEGRYLYITAKNIKESGIDLSDITYVDYAFHKAIYERCNPEKGDVLLTKDGAKTGVAAINHLEREFTLLSSVALLKPNTKLLNPYYLKNFLNSPVGFRIITGQMTGTAIKRIILDKIRASYIPLTSLSEQHQIVQQIEFQLSILNRVHNSVEDSVKHVARLRHSILQRAFEGMLVPQDTNEEAPSVLIGRERATEAQKRTKRNIRNQREVVQMELQQYGK